MSEAYREKVSKKSLKRQLKDLQVGDLICVSWTDASIGKSLGSGVAVDVPAQSWGIFIGLMGKRSKHIVLAQNNFQYSDGFYDIDYTAIPVSWTVTVNVVEKNHVAKDEAQILFTSFLRGGRRMSTQHKQQKVRNHGSY
jgi:hypothetical protein